MRIVPLEPGVSSPRAVVVEGTSAARPPAVERTGEPSPFGQLLHGLGRAINSGEDTLRQAIGGAHDMGPAELIALQAGVYRYSEAIDLASRLVERTTNGVKTIVQGSGQ